MCQIQPLASYMSIYHFEIKKWHQGGSVMKNLPATAGDAGDLGQIPRSGRSSGKGNGNPLQYSHGQRSLAGYSPWGHKEFDMTEVTQHIILSQEHIVKDIQGKNTVLVANITSLFPRRQDYQHLYKKTGPSYFFSFPGKESACTLGHLF